ncbi:23563_t:CDS:2 [Dentiscutata erythropus]|uniref:23563_t:CDS:1 n=1 Tax=Dentiscutata erythropus TaxID=1348616 RepID=A0A9N9D0Q3_9GLOM|nr:23563_t:CDS:2 [Dentiscutata erythropus]
MPPLNLSNLSQLNEYSALLDRDKHRVGSLKIYEYLRNHNVNCVMFENDGFPAILGRYKSKMFFVVVHYWNPDIPRYADGEDLKEAYKRYEKFMWQFSSKFMSFFYCTLKITDDVKEMVKRNRHRYNTFYVNDASKIKDHLECSEETRVNSYNFGRSSRFDEEIKKMLRFFTLAKNPSLDYPTGIKFHELVLYDIDIDGMNFELEYCGFDMFAFLDGEFGLDRKGYSYYFVIKDGTLDSGTSVVDGQVEALNAAIMKFFQIKWEKLYGIFFYKEDNDEISRLKAK